MVYLDDLIDLISGRGLYVIINRPYDNEHVLYRSWYNTPAIKLNDLLDLIGTSEVTEIQFSAKFNDARGSMTCAKIYVDIDAAYFDVFTDEDKYGSGLIDFYDIENGRDYNIEMYNTYKDLGFFIPGKNIKKPRE